MINAKGKGNRQEHRSKRVAFEAVAMEALDYPCCRVRDLCIQLGLASRGVVAYDDLGEIYNDRPCAENDVHEAVEGAARLGIRERDWLGLLMLCQPARRAALLDLIGSTFPISEAHRNECLRYSHRTLGLGAVLQ